MLSFGIVISGLGKLSDGLDEVARKLPGVLVNPLFDKCRANLFGEPFSEGGVLLNSLPKCSKMLFNISPASHVGQNACKHAIKTFQLLKCFTKNLNIIRMLRNNQQNKSNHVTFISLYSVSLQTSWF